MRITSIRESVLAFAERRKCWATGIRYLPFLIAIIFGRFDGSSEFYHIRQVLFVIGVPMAGVIAKTEDEWAERVRVYLKAELKKADVGYVELAKRLKKHGFRDETEASITNKLKRGTFSAIFLLACLAALEAEGVRLEDL
jgi:hypothetical protein